MILGDTIIGSVFTRLKVISHTDSYLSPSGKDSSSRVLCMCTCGSEKVVHVSSLKSGTTKSCGCLQRELASSRLSSHGDSQTKLYGQWRAMKVRSESRGDSCSIFPKWLVWKDFKNWAISSGWEEGLCLCRNGDTGNYEPANVRWDTKASNLREAFCKKWSVITPTGEVLIISDLKAFCKESKLNYTCMVRVANGTILQGHHKNYTCSKLGESV